MALKLRDGVTKGHPLLRIFQCRFKRALRDADGLCGDADTPAIQRRERDLVAFAFVADAVGHRHLAICEHQLAASGRIDPKFFLFLADFEARRALSTTNAVIPFSPLGGSVFT